MRLMKRDSLAIFYSGDPMRRSGDQSYPYRQDPILFSLSGIDQPGTVLVLIKSSDTSEDEHLFILPNDPHHTIWNGERLTHQAASAISGTQHVHRISQLDKFLQRTIPTVRHIYLQLPEGENSFSHTPAQRQSDIFEKTYPNHIILNAEPLLRKTSMVKHPMEVELIKKAVSITGSAFGNLLQHIKPGQLEYELEAHLTYQILKLGGRHAFEPIIASGKSACILHYTTNDRIIKPGTLVLIDFGAEYANMASDMTRTVPASGRFRPEQKKVYLSVMHVLDRITAMMRPGILLPELTAEAGRIIESELIKLKILSRHQVKQQDKAKPLWKKYFMHGVSHHLGYDVHDLSDRTAPLKPGMVVTCEPGLYIPELKMGIRLENDILITRGRPINLMADVPIDPDEIETLMKS